MSVKSQPQATLEEKKKLRKEFKIFDMIFIIVAGIIGLDTIGAVSSNGGQALTWLFISAITFFLPYGLLCAELGTTFPQEGGVYEWCKMAGGRYFAALASMLYWISNPLWIGGTLAITAIGAISLFFFGNINYQVGGSAATNAIFRIVVALIFIWGVTWSAILSLHVGKWLMVCWFVCQIRALRALRGACGRSTLLADTPLALTLLLPIWPPPQIRH